MQNKIDWENKKLINHEMKPYHDVNTYKVKIDKKLTIDEILSFCLKLGRGWEISSVTIHPSIHDDSSFFTIENWFSIGD